MNNLDHLSTQELIEISGTLGQELRRRQEQVFLKLEEDPGDEDPEVEQAVTQQADDRHTFTSGAMSSGKKPPYHLIPDYALRRIAGRFRLGAEKYGVDNWKLGARDPEFILDRINHGIEHLYQLAREVQSGKPSPSTDDDAAAVVLNAIFVMEYQRATP